MGEVTTAVSEIAASAQEQAAGLAEVNTAINQMDQVTQQNAAMVEQSTAASHSLAQETAKLILMTERFQIGGIGAAMANRVFETYDAIVDVCCDAWKSLITMPERITSIATRSWAQQVTV